MSHLGLVKIVVAHRANMASALAPILWRTNFWMKHSFIIQKGTPCSAVTWPVRWRAMKHDLVIEPWRLQWAR
jgi:hypothetical protein